MKNNTHLNISWGDFSTYRTELYGISALWVMVFHSKNVGIGYDGSILPLQFVQAIVGRGNMGVDIFLFLSGMSLFFAYSKNNVTPLSFQKRRFFRLFLPLWIIYTPYWIYRALAAGGLSDVSRLLLKVTALDFWATGSIEVWFIPFIGLCYLFYPYIHEYYKVSNRSRNLRLLALLALVVGASFCIMVSANEFYRTYEIAIGRLPIFLIGCWAGKLIMAKVPLPRWTIPAAYAMVIYWFIRYQFSPVSLPMMKVRYEYIFSSFAFMVVFIHLVRLLNWKWLQRVLHFCGTRSLELYLSHLMLISVYKQLPIYSGVNVLTYLVLMAVAVVIAYATERIVSQIQKKVFV